MGKIKGVVAAGHKQTAEAARIILDEGGNAFDAVLGALLASCVTEPVLASLGGGGFLLAEPAEKDPLLYDFFVHTPKKKIPTTGVDFFPIVADFGDAQQEFHIGQGSIAVPGIVKGLFEIHGDLCRLPLNRITEPACHLARAGVVVNEFQHYISSIVEPILRSTPQAFAIHRSPADNGNLARPGELVRHAILADTFEALVNEGPDLFYRGEMARLLVRDCAEHGGHLQSEDLTSYRIERRRPLRLSYHDAELITNPAPSVGGMLIAFVLSLLHDCDLTNKNFGDENHIRLLARAMRLTQKARREKGIGKNRESSHSQRLLDNEFMAEYRTVLRNHRSFSRGTTQISVADNLGNIASMTLSNGEGSGYVLPGTGIMLNNMLGEEDINPGGFHEWPENRRIASMMAPTLLYTANRDVVATGSGGSNRIRSAILQVLVNLVDFNMDLARAVNMPRVHYESGLLNIEPGISQKVLASLSDDFSEQKQWNEINLFFGGAHSVMRSASGALHGAGDPRRGGVCLYAGSPGIS